MTLKCEFCNKKVPSLLSFSCKCSIKVLCSQCRLPEQHKCTFDYIKEGKQILEKNNPKIESDKLIKI